jgi:hypothetical protein
MWKSMFESPPSGVVVYAALGLLIVSLLVIVVTRGQSRVMAAGVIVGLLLGPWWVLPELTEVTMTELPSLIADHWPELIPGLVFLYGFITLLLTTVLLTAGIMQARSRLAEAGTRDQLLAVFDQTGLSRLGPRIVGPVEPEGPMRDAVLTRSPFSFRRARREFAHLYRDRLIRVQFFTGVAGLLVIAALGWIQDYLHVPNFGLAIPAGPAFVAAVVLILLFVTVGRLAIDSAAKSLLKRTAELPFSSASNRTTLFIAAEADRVGTGSGSMEPIAAVAPMLDAIGTLIEIIERDRSSLHEPMMQLSASAEALAMMAKAISERPIDTAPAAAYAATGEELKTAIDRLTANIEQLTEHPPLPAYAAIGEQFDNAIDRLAAKIEQLAERPIADFEQLLEEFEEAPAPGKPTNPPEIG